MKCADFIFFTVVFLLSFLLVTGLKECKKVDACKCSTDKGMIDLWNLAGKHGQPRFKDIPDKNGAAAKFSWNPCEKWTLETADELNYCKNVAVCTTITSESGTAHFDTGEQDSKASFLLNTTTGNCYLKYAGSVLQQGSDNSFTYIALACDKDEEGILEDMYLDQEASSSAETVVRGRLVTKYACPISSGLSTGSVLLIIFFSLLIVYIVAGVLYNRFIQGSSGKELVPNYSFWLDLPELIKDGLVFTYKSSRKLCNRGQDGYASI